MSQMDIHKNIRQNKFAPIYLFYGIEGFLIEETMQEVIKHALTDDVIDFNLAVYDMEEVFLETALEDAETLPFLGEKRIVILKNATFLTTAKQKIEHDVKRLLQYVENPSESTILIIEVPFEKLDERKKVVKQVKKHAEVLEANQLNEGHLKQWITNRVELCSTSITNSAVEKLMQLSGSQLKLLVNEIEKMALYVGESGEITEEVVELLVARSLEQNIFTLIDKVTKRNIDEAFQILYDLLKQKEEPIKILSLLARQFRIIYQVKQLTLTGYGQKSIASAIKVHPYAVKLANEQGRKFSDSELLSIINQIANADYEMKSGAMDKQLILDLLITKLHKPIEIKN